MLPVKEALNHIAAETGDSLRDIAAKTGVSAGHLSRVGNPAHKEPMTLRVANALCAEYDVPVHIAARMFKEALPVATPVTGAAATFISVAMALAALNPACGVDSLAKKMGEFLDA